MRLLAILLPLMLLGSGTYGVTLDFDSVLSGTRLDSSLYALANRVDFDSFQAIDHSQSSWGLPHSPNNVLTALASSLNESRIYFGRRVTAAPRDDDHVQSVLAYFSTNLGSQVKITPYYLPEGAHQAVPLTSIIIGAPGESWGNVPILLDANPAVSFEMLRFEPVNLPGDLTGFCIDDMTITLVPEPSSLLALAGGLAGLVLRRRRR